jgi:hypothetical protein
MEVECGRLAPIESCHMMKMKTPIYTFVKNSHYLDEKWNHQKITLELITAVINGSEQELLMIGNSIDMGIQSPLHRTLAQQEKYEKGKSNSISVG